MHTSKLYDVDIPIDQYTYIFKYIMLRRFSNEIAFGL